MPLSTGPDLSCPLDLWYSRSMPTVEVIETIAAPIDEVWRVVCDVEKYPEIMDCVLDVQVLEKGAEWSICGWSVRLKGSILNWTEFEQRDRERYRVTYRQMEGDLERFDGHWQFVALAERLTRASLHVEFEIGIPMLREMLDPVATRALEENSRLMLRSLEPR
jgi:ribosome-associated toxin RatA of RatAB toxin-antitoxin module